MNTDKELEAEYQIRENKNYFNYRTIEHPLEVIINSNIEYRNKLNSSIDL